MLRVKVRWILLGIACGGWMLGAGCGSMITDSLLRLGLVNSVSQLLGGGPAGEI